MTTTHEEGIMPEKDYSTDTLTKALTTPYNERRSMSGDTTVYVDGDPEDGADLVRVHDDARDGLILVEVKTSAGRWLSFADIDPDSETLDEAAETVTQALTFATAPKEA